ncbi:MAG: inorganic phosphate transporter, partial [Deltaproteobacteria bacterium]|nr:inorganic phosphate transporter [Deltaproteobacteria bacterium]
ALWLNIATYAGWPVSTTHSIVGAVVGFGLIAGGFGAVNWLVMGKIAASWVVSPLLGGLLGFYGFVFIKRRILNVDRPLLALRGWGPIMIFPIFAILALSVLFKGLKPLKLDLGLGPSIGIAVAVGLLASILSVPLLRRVTRSARTRTSTRTARSECFWCCRCSLHASSPLRTEATTWPTRWARWRPCLVRRRAI